MSVVVKLFLSNLPIILHVLVSLAEALHPAQGSGEQKAVFVLKGVSDIVDNHPELKAEAETIADTAKTALEQAVQVFKTASGSAV